MIPTHTFHAIIYLKQQRLQKHLFNDEARNLELTLTFFFGRFTSSFIEAHLFKVLSRLKEKWPEDEKCSEHQEKTPQQFLNEHSKNKPHSVCYLTVNRISLWSGCTTRPREKFSLSMPQYPKSNEHR